MDSDSGQPRLQQIVLGPRRHRVLLPDEPTKLGAASARIVLSQRPSLPVCHFAIGNARTLPGIQVNIAFSPLGSFQKKTMATPRQKRRYSTDLNQTEWFDRGQAYQPHLPFHSGYPGIYLEKIPAGKPAVGFCSFKELETAYYGKGLGLPIVTTTFFT